MNPSNQHFDVARLNAVPITQLAEHYDTVRKVGKTSFTRCPWHDDHHPSLALYDGEGMKASHCKCYSCNVRHSPIDFVIQQEHCTFLEACDIIGRMFGILPDAHASARYMRRPREKPVAKAPVVYTYIPMEWVESQMSIDNSFCQCLMRHFNPYHVQQVTEDYLLGAYDNGHQSDCVLFPSIDEQGRVHNVKVQHYCTDQGSPEFFHRTPDVCYWLGKRLADLGVVPKDALFDNNCLFGAHLLARYPSAPVILVESPKNAVIGAAAFPQFLWLAAGSENMLSRQALQCLKGRLTLVYPDRDAISNWTAELQKMEDITHFQVSSLCERVAPADLPKYDVADYILQHLRPII